MCEYFHGFSAINKLLTENEANPNIIIPDRGISPFHLAIGHGSETNAIEITKLFLAHDGNPNIRYFFVFFILVLIFIINFGIIYRSDEGLTPVHIAAAWGRLQILSILLCCGGDPSLNDEENKTSLDYAKQEGHLDIVNFLQNYLIDFNNLETCCDKLSYDITLGNCCTMHPLFIQLIIDFILFR